MSFTAPLEEATVVEALLLRPHLAGDIAATVTAEDFSSPTLARIFTAAAACSHIAGIGARYRAVHALVPDLPPWILFELDRPTGEVRDTLHGVDHAAAVALAAERRTLVASLDEAMRAVEAGERRDVVLARLHKATAA